MWLSIVASKVLMKTLVFYLLESPSFCLLVKLSSLLLDKIIQGYVALRGEEQGKNDSKEDINAQEPSDVDHTPPVLSPATPLVFIPGDRHYLFLVIVTTYSW